MGKGWNRERITVPIEIPFLSGCWLNVQVKNITGPIVCDYTSLILLPPRSLSRAESRGRPEVSDEGSLTSKGRPPPGAEGGVGLLLCASPYHQCLQHNRQSEGDSQVPVASAWNCPNARRVGHVCR